MFKVIAGFRMTRSNKIAWIFGFATRVLSALGGLIPISLRCNDMYRLLHLVLQKFLSSK